MIQSQTQFGFVTGCHAGDKFMVGATLASMRHFCPDIPICLVVDGDFDVSDLQIQYDLILLRISNLSSERIKETIGGNYRAKLAAMWEGPFDYYVWLDSDAIVWGDFTDQVRRDVDFHIFWEENAPGPAKDVSAADWGGRHFYFDPVRLGKYDPDFLWKDNNYFCSGAFACRKHVFSFEEWLQVEKWEEETEGLFSWGEMGMLNYIIHSKAQRGEITTDSSNLQHVWAHHGKRELQIDCTGAGYSWPDNISRPRVAHFCYRKPNVFDRLSYSKPFTIARLAHYRVAGYSKIASWSMILREDLNILYLRIKKRLLLFLR